MRSALPSFLDEISYVHVPPKGSFGSAMRTTKTRGGTITITSYGIDPPRLSNSRHDGFPFTGGSISTRITPLRHAGNFEYSVIACQIASGGWWNCAAQVEMCRWGRNAPIATTTRTINTIRATSTKIPARIARITTVPLLAPCDSIKPASQRAHYTSFTLARVCHIMRFLHLRSTQGGTLPCFPG